jgi:hypothetical protein
LETILSKLLPVEHRLGTTERPGEVTAHSAKHWKPKGQRGRRPDQSGTPEGRRPSTNDSPQARKKGNCHYCGKAGHWADKCPERARDRESSDRDDNAEHFVAGCAIAF